jgi:hypothetical protein
MYKDWFQLYVKRDYVSFTQIYGINGLATCDIVPQPSANGFGGETSQQAVLKLKQIDKPS